MFKRASLGGRPRQYIDANLGRRHRQWRIECTPTSWWTRITGTGTLGEGSGEAEPGVVEVTTAVDNARRIKVDDLDRILAVGCSRDGDGIVTSAQVTFGDAYRQEYHHDGKAEGMGELIEVGATFDDRIGEYANVVVTHD